MESILGSDGYRHAFSEKPMLDASAPLEKPMADVASMVVSVRSSSYVLRVNEPYGILCISVSLYRIILYYTVYRLGCLRCLVWGMVCVVGWLNIELGDLRGLGTIED